MPASVSVALATCNGERFLQEFLESLARQTQLPMELIVSDDASDDATVATIESFSANAPFPVHVERNRQRLGVIGNFTRSVLACNGELIALADQDDVWREDKLEKLAVALAGPEIIAAFSDAAVVDEKLESLGYTMWELVRFHSREQIQVDRGDAFDVFLKHRVVTGATLVFKSALRATALPIPTGWLHDAWLAQIAASLGRLVAIPEPLVAYRQHANNVVGGRRRTLLEEARATLAIDRTAWYQNELSQWRTLAVRLGYEAPPALREKIKHLEARAALPSARLLRLPGILRELLTGRYRKYARNYGSLVIDLLVK